MRSKTAPTSLFPSLEHSAKGRFPFSLACPSFVYRAGYTDNVRHLAPFVDQIQLLFFESRPPESLPGPHLVQRLAALAADHAITFNIHLPSDIFLGHPDPLQRQHALQTLRQIFDQCTPLHPITYTLHLDKTMEGTPSITPSQWRSWQIETLSSALEAGVAGRQISVETLDYPLDEVAPVIEQLDLSVCMDMGHLMVHGVDIVDFFNQWKDRISIIHLHGVDGTKDHLALDRLSTGNMNKVMEVLMRFCGPVTLEVYSYEALNASIQCLLHQWNRIVQ